MDKRHGHLFVSPNRYNRLTLEPLILGGGVPVAGRPPKETPHAHGCRGAGSGTCAPLSASELTLPNAERGTATA